MKFRECDFCDTIVEIDDNGESDMMACKKCSRDIFSEEGEQ